MSGSIEPALKIFFLGLVYVTEYAFFRGMRSEAHGFTV
jgi:hypothetical protein